MLTSGTTDATRLLGDPLRSQIVRLLARESLCTCHLVTETGASQTNLSNHLRVLREAGVIAAEPCGRYTYYRLRPEILEDLAVQFRELAQLARETHACDRKRPC